jgi:chloramphenicol 3-O-phosphotransferase
MKLVIIYGSEASGKLSVAKQLAELTNLRLFHNHVSIDVAKVLFNYGEADYDQLLWKIRLLVFETAAQKNVPGLIFTWAYSHPDFQPLLDRLLRTLKPYEVETQFVYLKCSQVALESRVQSVDRIIAGKIHTIDQLHKQQQRKHHAEIPGTDSLVIDNTNLSPPEAATLIAEKLTLRESSNNDGS